VIIMSLASGFVAPAAALDGERPALDGSIREQDLRHDSCELLYRAPGGAVPAGTLVKLRLRAAAGDLSDARAHFTDRASDESWFVPMARVASEPDEGDFGYDYWQVEVQTLPGPMILDYSFEARDGQSSRHVFYVEEMEGATSRIARQLERGHGWQLTFYHPVSDPRRGARLSRLPAPT
jgi:hypothetical protein